MKVEINENAAKVISVGCRTVGAVVETMVVCIVACIVGCKALEMLEKGKAPVTTPAQARSTATSSEK